jgi:hypothetical protein
MEKKRKNNSYKLKTKISADVVWSINVDVTVGAGFVICFS